MIKVLKVEPKRKPEVIEIEPNLETLQTLVEGYIECFYPFDEPVCLLVNEEGKISGMELNRGITAEDGELVDIIAGPFLVVSLIDETGNDDGEFHSLSDEYLEKFAKRFERPETFYRGFDGLIHTRYI